MRACRKYVLVTVSSKVSASLSSSTTRGLTGCTRDSQFSLGHDRAMLAHEVAERADAVSAGPPRTRLSCDVGHAPGTVGDRFEHVAVGHHGAMAHVHRRIALTGSWPELHQPNRWAPRGG